MKNEPCVRLGMRMRPKISEKPADSKNSNPPNAMLLTVRTSHKLIIDPAALPDRVALRFQRRIIARIDRLREEGLLVIGPELADILVGLDRLVHELAVLLLNAANVDIAD